MTVSRSTDVLFAIVHPELGGGRIPDGHPEMVDEWVALRRRHATPALRAAAGSGPGSAVAGAGTGGPRTGGGGTGVAGTAVGIPDATTVPATATDTAAAGQGGPAVAPVGGTTFGAGPMDPVKRARALEGAMAQVTTAGVAEDRDAITDILGGPDGAKAWFGDLVFNATFLDVRIIPSGEIRPGCPPATRRGAGEGGGTTRALVPDPEQGADRTADEHP